MRHRPFGARHVVDGGHRAEWRSAAVSIDEYDGRTAAPHCLKPGQIVTDGRHQEPAHPLFVERVDIGGVALRVVVGCPQKTRAKAMLKQLRSLGFKAASTTPTSTQTLPGAAKRAAAYIKRRRLDKSLATLTNEHLAVNPMH
jgi:hypothetical protein